MKSTVRATNTFPTALFFTLLFVIQAMWMVAASAQEPYFKGKTVRIIVGFSAGGGYDVYARAIARHMGKHIPGNPSLIVENMTGAGSRVAANYLFKAPADGLIIGNFIG